MSAWDIFVFSGFTATAFALMRVKSFSRRTPSAPQQPVLIRKRHDVFPVGDRRKDRVTVRFDQWLDRVLNRSGIALDRISAILLIVCIGLTATAVAFVFEMNLWVQLLAGMSASAVVMLGLIAKMNRRIQSFSRLLPTSLELVARATRAGESFESALRIAANASPEPVKSEFSVCVRQLELGRRPASAIEDLAKRLGTTDTHLFAHTVSIQQTLGGRLATALERMADVIRDRFELNEKFKAATGIGRYAVFSMVSMGLFVFIYMQFAQPEYIGKLVESSLGYKLVAYAVASEVVGLVWVAITLNSQS